MTNVGGEGRGGGKSRTYFEIVHRRVRRLAFFLLETKRGKRSRKYAVIRAFREGTLSVAGFPSRHRYFPDSNWKFKLPRVLAVWKTDTWLAERRGKGERWRVLQTRVCTCRYHFVCQLRNSFRLRSILSRVSARFAEVTRSANSTHAQSFHSNARSCRRIEQWNIFETILHVEAWHVERWSFETETFNATLQRVLGDLIQSVIILCIWC